MNEVVANQKVAGQSCRCCKCDIEGLRKYNRRFKVCQKCHDAPEVQHCGRPMRFCQKCFKFEAVQLFDGTKRSCRVALQKYSIRRREKMKKEIQSAGAISPSLFRKEFKPENLVRSNSPDIIALFHQLSKSLESAKTAVPIKPLQFQNQFFNQQNQIKSLQTQIWHAENQSTKFHNSFQCAENQSTKFHNSFQCAENQNLCLQSQLQLSENQVSKFQNVRSSQMGAKLELVDFCKNCVDYPTVSSSSDNEWEQKEKEVELKLARMCRMVFNRRVNELPYSLTLELAMAIRSNLVKPEIFK